ncbi:MAG: GNAT family N-acetyltransferase [Nostoc sp. CreGUA01]
MQKVEPFFKTQTEAFPRVVVLIGGNLQSNFFLGRIMINIREAKLEDIDTLFKIRTSVGENYQSREELAELGVTPQTVANMLQTDCCAWIGEINRQAVGFSMANATQKTIFGMFVLPAFEGRGVGRQLMQKAEEWLWSQGAEEIWLLTGNDPAFRAYGFYLHLEWIPVEVQSKGEVKFIKKRASINPHTLSK